MNSFRTRREFLTQTLTGSAALCLGAARLPAAEKTAAPSIVVFSKVYQELKLGFSDAAALTAEAGLQGVDAPVREGGEVLPERVTEDLPRYVDELRKHGLSMPLLTTGIIGADSPHAEELLRTAKKLGARWYRLGFVYRDAKVAAEKQIAELRPRLKELAALNKEIGLGALFQNHSPAGKSVYLGGDLSEMRQLVEGFDPKQLGVAFDIGHALAVHGAGWRDHFQALRDHFQIAYVKDVTRDRKWVALGSGQIESSGYFHLLKELHYSAPFSLHIEYDWEKSPDVKSRSSLLKVLQENSAVLRNWCANA